MKKHIFYTMLVLLMSSLSSSLHATVTVTWAADATANIQAAIDTADPDIIIPNVGQDWVVRPLFLNSDNQQITFAPGVVVKAKAGGFPNVGDCMFSAVNKSNITLSGYGATLQMLKSEYTTGEWRHTISFKTCTNIDVLGLTALDSGGDGVFVGDSYTFPYHSLDVLIKDCVFNNHRRLGSAVVSGKNVTFENCVFSNSVGTAPQGGVDLEPDQANQRLENIDFWNCFCIGNYGGGYMLATSRFNATSTPVDVELHRCYAEDQGPDSNPLYLLPATVATGSYKTTDCTFSSDGKACLKAERNYSNAITYLATNCRFESRLQNPLRIFDSATPQCGNLTFTNCVAHYQGTNPYISWEIFDGVNSGIANIAGNIDVYNPNGATTNWGSNYSNITLVTTPHNTKVPVVAITAPAMGATLATGDTLTFTATAYDPDIGTTDGSGMSQVVFEVWRCDNAANTLKSTSTDTGAAYSAAISTSGWAQGIYMLVARGVSADGSEKRRMAYIRISATGPVPVCLYRFNETSGTVAADTVRVGSGNATVYGGATWTTSGKIGGAIQLDGVNDYALALNAVPSGSTSFTISAWVNAASAATWGTIVKNWGMTQTGAFHFGFDSTTGKISNQLATGTKTLAPTTLSLNVWHHVAVTYNGATATQVLYIDGTAVNTQTNAPASVTALSPNMGIGVKTTDNTLSAATSSAGYWSGKLDDLAFFNTALSAGEIATIKTNGDSGIGIGESGPPNLQGRWLFDEGSGTTSADASGNGNLATLFNGVTWGTGKSGSAAVLDGVNDWVKVNYNTNLFCGATDAWSLSVWLKTPGSASAQWFYYTNATSLSQFISVTVEATGKVNFATRDSANKRHYTYGVTSIANNQWHHIVVVRDGSLNGTAGAQKIYIDGALEAATHTVDVGQSGNFYSGTAEMRIGRSTDAGTSYFNGTIDQYRIYRTVLSAADVLSFYNNGL